MCWYHGKSNPLLKIRPIKVEMVFRKPRIFMFRGLVSPAEATRIKEIATPKVTMATTPGKPLVVSVNFCFVLLEALVDKLTYWCQLFEAWLALTTG